jgi:hypothetical protein
VVGSFAVALGARESECRVDVSVAVAAKPCVRERCVMRTMMRVTIPVEAGNRAIADGTLPKTIEAAMESLKPEAAYFVDTGGKRSALLFFDLADASDIPSIAEPFFQNLNASVEFSPVMNAEDLQAGFGKMG